MTDTGLVNLRWSHALVDGFAAAGVRRAVISPGSRSTPLVLACHRHPSIRTQVHLDERGAAFFALGQARVERQPTLLIATSGSAPGHWFPAVMEAAAGGVPLILLSADRPPELQDWGANQTLDQQRLFGVHARAFHAAGLPEDTPSALRQIRLLGVKSVEQSLWPKPGPVHINQPFREPLVPTATEADWPSTTGPAFELSPGEQRPDTSQLRRLAKAMRGTPGLIVCGPRQSLPGDADAVGALARKLDCPILADPLSGMRFGPWTDERILVRYDDFLNQPENLPPPAWVLQVGAAPISKNLHGFLQDCSADQWLLAAKPDWAEPGHRVTEVIRSDIQPFCTELGKHLEASAGSELFSAFFAAEQESSKDTRGFEARLIEALFRQIPAHSSCLVGNSLAVRLFDRFSGRSRKPLNIHCNRGVSGIDGNLATLAGIASLTPGRSLGLIGDLTLIHDLGSLALARQQEAIIVVLNNHGGGIFRQLPQAGLAAFERYWLTPQDLDLAKAADLYGLAYSRATDLESFSCALSEALRDSSARLIEVVL